MEINILNFFRNNIFFRVLSLYIGCEDEPCIGFEIGGLETTWNWYGLLIIYWERYRGWRIDFMYARWFLDKVFGDWG